METTHRKSGYGSVSLIRDRTVTVIDEMNDLGETLLVRAILITGEAVAHGRLVIQVIGRSSQAFSSPPLPCNRYRTG